MTSLTRADLIDGLRDLVAQLRADGAVVGIRLVGGAALALRYFDRGVTQDIDMLHVQPGTDAEVVRAATRVADRHNWDADWVNFRVTEADAIPTLGREVEWEVIHDSDGIVIEVASKEAMLAMKLRASRPGRDTDDIRKLVALCQIDTLETAENLYESFYPGDGLTDRAVTQLTNILREEVAPRDLGVPSFTL